MMKTKFFGWWDGVQNGRGKAGARYILKNHLRGEARRFVESYEADPAGRQNFMPCTSLIHLQLDHLDQSILDVYDKSSSICQQLLFCSSLISYTVGFLYHSQACIRKCSSNQQVEYRENLSSQIEGRKILLSENYFIPNGTQISFMRLWCGIFWNKRKILKKRRKANFLSFLPVFFFMR